MERLRHKESETIQMQYAAPYAQSWASIRHQRKSLSPEETSSKIYNSPKVRRRPRRQEHQHLFTGLDPTVPHLKYGLFPKKINISRGQSHAVASKPSARFPCQSADGGRGRSACPRNPRRGEREEPERVNERAAIRKTSTIQKFLQKPRAQGQLAPKPVFRAMDTSSIFRCLTVSASTHLDIKPRPPRTPALLPPEYRKYL